LVAYVRTVKTASGATAVQIVWSTRRGSRQIEHLGSAHDGGEVEALKAAARQRLAEGQGALDRGLNTVGADGDPLEIVASKSSHLWDGLCRAYQVLGFDTATGGDEVFRDLVFARIIEPTSKQDAAPAGDRQTESAPGIIDRMCGPRRSRPSQPGALRRQHFVLRNRYW
jgi:hypothetical protein